MTAQFRIATNIEIYDYINAMRNLVLSADNTTVYNPSAVDVYASVNDECVCFKSGQITKL